MPCDATINFGIGLRIEVYSASRGFPCDSNALELNSSINDGKITVLNISIFIAFKLII